MTPRERVLYHQVHPAKVATDATSGLLALIVAWRGRPWVALSVVAIPSALSSVVLIALVDLEPQEWSRAGAYMRKYMHWPAQLGHVAGYTVAFAGAAGRRPYVLAVGAGVTAVSWFYPFLLPPKRAI